MNLKKVISHELKPYSQKRTIRSNALLILLFFAFSPLSNHEIAHASINMTPVNDTFYFSSAGNNIYLYLNRNTILYENDDGNVTSEESIYNISLSSDYLTIDVANEGIYLKTDDTSSYRDSWSRPCPIVYNGYHGNGTPLGLAFFNDPSENKTLKIDHTGEDYVIAPVDTLDQNWFLFKVNGNLDITHTINEYTGNSGTIHMPINEGTEERKLIVTGDLSIHAKSESATGSIGYFSGILSEHKGYIQVGGDVDISMECSPSANDESASISGIALVGNSYLSHLDIAGHTYIHDIKSTTSNNSISNHGFYINNWNSSSLIDFNTLTISDIKAVSIDGTAYAAGIHANYTRVPVTVSNDLIIKNIAAISDGSSTGMTSGAYGQNAEAYAIYSNGSLIDIQRAKEIEGDIASIKYSSYYNADIDIDFLPSGIFTGFTRTGEDFATLDISLPTDACWNVVPSNAVTADARGSYVSNLTGLSLDGSSVYVGSTADSWINNTQSNNLFASTFAPLSSTDTPTELVVSHLSGAGDFYLRTELNGEGETDRSDSVRITESIDYAESPFLLHVKGSGSKLEQTDSYLVRTESDVVVTGADSGAAVTGNEFALYGGQVDIGEYIYTLENASRNDGREWYLVRNNTMSPTGETEAALSGFAGHYAMWYGYQTDLRKRLGEIRYGTQTGLWIRGFADKVRLDGLGGTNFTQNLVGGSIGYDTLADVDETYMWLVGMQIRSGHADQRTNGRWDGYGDLTSIGGGLYSTWVHVDGWYLDAVATMDWFNHEIRTSMLDGTGVHDDRSSYGIGASLEAGRKINFAYSNEDRDYWFLEPQLQLSWFWVRGGDYRADNGMTIEQNDMASLTGRAGLVLGKKFTLEDDPFHPRYVQPYIKAGVNHEFLGDQTARINGHRYTSELDGTRVYYGFGADWQATDNLRIYMQAEREHGENFTREYNVSAGLKFKF